MSLATFRMKAGVSIVALTLAGVALAQTPAAKPARIRGEIVSLSGDVLTVHRRSGDTVTIDLKSDTPVTAVKNIALSDIKQGSFIGTAATTGTDGKMTATEVLVFPEAARGSGEGHYAWDLAPNSTMTNANVDQVVTGTSGRDLKLSYKGGSNTVTVPEGVPVVTFAPATRTDLVAGKKVFVVASPVKETEFAASRVVVEKDGVAPPM
jgi:glucose dehydrogenase